MSYVKHRIRTRIIQYVFGSSGYMALWTHSGVIWWLRVLEEVRVRDWRYFVMLMGHYVHIRRTGWRGASACPVYHFCVGVEIMGTEKWHRGGYIV